MSALRLAFLGCGDVAVRDYLPELPRLAGRAELVAVCGRTEARARSVGEQYGVPWFTDYRRMLAESGADAVVNLTPIQLHFETTLACLEAGKHVYCEKPVTGSVREAERLHEEAARSGLTVVCAPSVLLFPQLRRARSLLAEDAIGAVTGAQGHGHGGIPPWGGYLSDPAPFFAAGGGPLRDMGVYPLHALTGLLGPVRRVAAFCAQTRRGFTIADGPFQGREVPIAVPDHWRLLLELESGHLASIDANNCVTGTRAPQLEIFGRQGTIALDLLDVSAPIDLLRAGRGWERIDLPRTGRERGPDHLLGVEHLVECARTGARPIASLPHALHVVEIIEKAEQSAADGRAREVGSRY
jgi:predicted dehydrogenase